MNQCFSETKDSVNDNDISDSFAKHFASHFPNENHIDGNDARDTTNIEIIWQGNPVSSVKTFKNPNCSLCTRERLEIYKAIKLNKKLIKQAILAQKDDVKQ